MESQPNTTRVSNLADFYRARFLYRLSLGGEAVESSLEMFSEAMKRRAELQSVALEDIATRLKALHLLVTERRPGVIKVHKGLWDLVHRFEGLSLAGAVVAASWDDELSAQMMAPDVRVA